ncbi:MAG: ketopantoate reductase family protein [Candidatus Kariarchaeaceae archaeon]|jgi:2-dehydropantoate 2-reductase
MANNPPKTAQSILIAGAGSIGTVVGMLLHQQANEVNLFRRGKSSGEQTLKMIGIDNYECKLRIYNISQPILQKTSAELIIITTQAQQTSELMDHLLEICDINSHTLFLTLQNGLTAPSIIAKTIKNRFGFDPILIQGTIWWSATLIDDSTVLYHKKASTVIGIPKASSASANHLDKIYQLLSSSFEVYTTDDILNESRKKLLLNVVSPVLALLNQPYPAGLNNLIAREIVHALYDEVLQIANNENWQISDERLDYFHTLLSSEEIIEQTDEYHIDESLYANIIHKVSTQISAEKHGGRASNARELLGYFVERGAKLCTIILEKVEQLPKNYVALPLNQLEKIINQHSVETCKFDKSNEINKFNYK